jgi:hypothetical protein
MNLGNDDDQDLLDDEAHADPSINSNQTNFLSKFKDSYNIDQSLNSINKTEDNKPSRVTRANRHKSISSKLSQKPDQSKDLTTLHVNSPNTKKQFEFNKSMGKLSQHQVRICLTERSTYHWNKTDTYPIKRKTITLST